MESKSLVAKVKDNKMFYLFLLPAVLFFTVMTIYPFITGLLYSFTDYGLLGPTEFVGLDNYVAVLTDPAWREALETTIVVTFFTMLLEIFLPLFMAILLYESVFKKFKSTLQSVSYVPKLLSGVVLVGIFANLLSAGAPISDLLYSLGLTETPENLMASEQYIRAILVSIMVWSNLGYYTIMYTAALLAIDESLFEAAAIDGASWIQKIRNITIPGVSGMMKVVTLLSMMGTFQAFTVPLLLSNPTTKESVNTLAVYTYDVGILQYNIGMSVASASITFIMLISLSLIVRKIVRY